MTTASLPDFDGIDWVRLLFVDIFGVGHVVHLPASRFDEVAEHGLVFDGSALEGASRNLEQDMRLVPDPTTLMRWRDRTAQVVCTARTVDGHARSADPRVALQAVVERLEAFGADYTVAAELEFYVLTADGQPVDDGGYYDADEGTGVAVARAAANRLIANGIAVARCHHEAGPGQYELDLEALPALELADAVVLATHLVREEATRAGLRATFMPRPLDGQAGSGLHLHQMVGDLLIDTKGALTIDGRAFVAGQLSHARALSALCAPTVNSYKRLHSGPEAPNAVEWARHNRGALVRVSGSIEYRGADPSANPYLAVAALLVAGADGIEAGTALPPPSEEDSVGGFEPATTRFEPLPRSIDDALDALESDDALLDAFDGQLLARLINGRRIESNNYRSRVSQWEIDNYFEKAGDWRGPT